MNEKLKGILYLTTAVISFGLVHIIDKIGLNAGVEPGIFALSRGLIAMTVVGLIWFAARKKHKLSFKIESLKNIAIIGLLTSGLGSFTVLYALNFTTATNRGLMQGLYVAATAIIAYFLIKERLPKLFFPIFLVIIIGLILLTSNGLIHPPNIGDWILIALAPVIGFTNTYAKKTMATVDSLTLTFGRYIFGSIALAIALAIFGLKDPESAKLGWEWILLSGSLTGIRTLTFYKGIQMLGATIGATFISIGPAVTAIGAFFILDEILSPIQGLGMLMLLLGGVALTQLKSK
jgi:drug/metabolite transporter (DMT)-like permease